MLEQARSQAPDQPALNHNLGVLYLAEGRLDEARQRFEHALFLDRSLAAAHAGLAEVRLRQGEAAAALSSAQEAVRLDPAVGHLDVLGQVLLALRDTNRARSAFVQCLMKDPDAIRCLGGMGVVYAMEGQRDKARENWMKILSLEPTNKAARENLDRLEKTRTQSPFPLEPEYLITPSPG